MREELERRKRALSVITYDDLLTRLREALRGPEGAAAVERLRARYRVVLVDEFQDTDPIQWEILERAFGDQHTTLVLIGDPKQAIYAFRGADVYSYLEAADAAGVRKTLEVNRRSDQALIDAYDAMFGGAKLGHEGIVYGRVRAAAGAGEPRRVGAPLRVRVVDRSELELTQQGFAKLNSARERVARDVAEDLVESLGAGAAPGRGRRAGAHQQAGAVGPRRARRARRPGRHQRRRQRVRDAGGARVAAAARGARAPGIAGAGARRRR